MHIVRMVGSGVVLAGLAFFSVTVLPGCDSTEETGSQVKVDPNEAADRAKKIQELYKANPPNKQAGKSAGPDHK
jgi:hypothetical protein